MGSVFGALAGMSLLVILVVVVVGLALAALMLTVSFRLVVGHMPSFLRAVGVVLLTAIAAAAVLGVLGAISHGTGRLLGIVVQFLVGAAMVNLFLLGDTGQRIGFGKACLVQLVYTVMEIVIGVILVILAVAVFGAALASMHH